MKPFGLSLLLSLVSISCDMSPLSPGTDYVPGTARYKLHEITMLARSEKEGLQLISVRSDDVSTDGTSQRWRYVFVDTAAPYPCYWFHASLLEVGLDSISPALMGIAIITHAWFNSDSALSLAEHSGGSEFRTSTTDFIISAGLGEPLVPTSRTYWWVRYSSRHDNTRVLFMSIDASTGAVDTKYPM